MKPNEPPTEFARAVRAARGAGTSQAKLAARLGVAPSTIYRVERGERPSPEVEVKLRRWCRELPLVDSVPSNDADAPRKAG
jgi:transcriptional regulator with XRE-family HTH domain